MFSNIGNKVCAVAKFCGYFGAICFLIGLGCTIFGFLDEEDLIIVGIPAMFYGLLSIISSWPLYAFGQITSDIREIKENINKS